MKRIIAPAALSLSAMALLSGCINNDVPYPQIEGQVTEIEIEGASNITIERSKRTISFDLAETVDLRKVAVQDLRVTSDSRVIDNYTQQEVDTLATHYVDLTQGSNKYAIQNDPAYSFTVITYQEYVWTLEATQTIDRGVAVRETTGNQIGNAQFSSTSNTVTVTVSEDFDLTDVQFEKFQLAPSFATYAPHFDQVTDFSLPQTFKVSYFDITEEWVVIFEKSTEAVSGTSVNPWASHAYLSAEGMTSAGTCGFQIKLRGAAENAWQEVPDVVVSGQTFTGKAEGLQPSTDYVMRAYIGDYYTAEVNFTTDQAYPVRNLNFDEWTYNENNKTWYPNDDAANSLWATGNRGVTMSGKESISVPTDDAVSGKAAHLSTISGVLFAEMAAGNLFLGDFSLNSIPGNRPAMRKIPKFGRPFTGRPLQMTGYFKYFPQIIDIDPDNLYPELMGTMDECHIYISIENWDGADERPLGTEETSLDHWSVLGYGEFQARETVSGYTPFTIDIEYKDLVTKPTHIVIVATSSRRGGDFCGATGSQLYVDEFELIY